MADEIANTAMTSSTQAMSEAITVSPLVINELIREQFVQFLAGNNMASPEPSNNTHSPSSSETEPVVNSHFLDHIPLATSLGDEETNVVSSTEVTDLISNSLMSLTESLTTADEFSPHTVSDGFEDLHLRTNLIETKVRNGTLQPEKISAESSETDGESISSAGNFSEVTGDNQDSTHSYSSNTTPEYAMTSETKPDSEQNTRNNELQPAETTTSKNLEYSGSVNDRFSGDEHSFNEISVNDESKEDSKPESPNKIDSSSLHTASSESTIGGGSPPIVPVNQSVGESLNDNISSLADVAFDSGDSNVGDNLSLIGTTDAVIPPKVPSVNEHDNSLAQLSSHFNIDDLDYPNYLYNYDYEPSPVLFSNVLPPSQMATDAFEEGMDFTDASALPEDYDYYSQKIYLDDATQVRYRYVRYNSMPSYLCYRTCTLRCYVIFYTDILRSCLPFDNAFFFSQDYYEKQYLSNESNATQMQRPISLDFPGKDVAASYHPVEVEKMEIIGKNPIMEKTSTNSQEKTESSFTSVSAPAAAVVDGEKITVTDSTDRNQLSEENPEGNENADLSEVIMSASMSNISSDIVGVTYPDESPTENEATETKPTTSTVLNQTVNSYTSTTSKPVRGGETVVSCYSLFWMIISLH